jgi:hypothetical protein
MLGNRGGWMANADDTQCNICCRKSILHHKDFAMKPRTPKSRARKGERTGYGGKVNVKRTCPLCATQVIRIRRRFIDHLLSFFLPVQRYRCPETSCQWEGNLRVRRKVLARPVDARAERRTHRSTRGIAT